MVNQLSLMVQKVYLEIHLNVLFFDNFILVNELFEKILRELKTCLLDNNDFCGQPASLKGNTFDASPRVTSVALLLISIYNFCITFG